MAEAGVVTVIDAEDVPEGGLSPRYLGLGYLAFGAAMLFAPRPSRAMAIATGAFAGLMGISAIHQWRTVTAKMRADEAKALRTGGVLGESLPESLQRTKDAIGKK